MKNRVALIAAIFCFTSHIGAMAQNDFKAEFAKYDSLQNISQLVYHGTVTPHWIDASSFWYETMGANGLKYYKVDVTQGTKVELPKESVQAPEVSRNARRTTPDTVPSPNNAWQAIIKDSNIWLKDVSTGKEIKLSYDGTVNHAYLYLYWSPDSQKLAAIKKQDSPMRKIPLIESSPSSQLQPILQWRDYYKPGDMIPIFRPALFDVATKSKIEINTQPFEFQYNLRFGRWSSDSRSFTFDFNQRGHQRYQLVGVRADTGETWIVAEEKSDTFVYYNRIYAYYTKDDKVIWASERDNWRHLYLIDKKTGSVERPLTQGAWVVREVLHVNEEERFLLLTGNGKCQTQGEDPYNIHYFRVNLDTGELIDLTPEEGNHRGFFSSDFKFLVDSYSRPDTPPISVVRSATDGRVVMPLQKADISPLLKRGYTLPEVFHTKGRDGETEIWGTIYRPFNFNPKKSYPVVEYIYAGPHDSFVVKDFVVYSRFSKLLELGFIVVQIDGMGTANRSKSFHDVAWRNLKDSGFPDRIIWIKEAANKYKYMDINRMGIYGYSAGGQSTLAGLLFHGDFYKVGVALCGCHDNRMDKIWWNEQWMGYPIGPWYAENSNVDNAHLLQGKLLLINGELDDNVDPTSTLQVVNALIKADKDFEQLYLPGYSHSLADNYVTRRVFEFLVKHLR